MLAGFAATLGATGLFAGLAIPVVGVVAGVWMVAYFVVASLSHLVRADFKNFGIPLFLGLFFIGLIALRWSDATPVLALIGLS